jgi:conjugal transfer pilus assembly protein TraB
VADFKKMMQDAVAKLTAKNSGSSSSGAAPAATGAAGGAGPAKLSLSFPKDVKKRWMLIGGVLAVGVAAIGSMATSPAPAPVKRVQKADDRMVDITPKGLDKQSWQAQSMAEIEQLKQLVNKQSKENERLNQSLQTLADHQKAVEEQRAKEAKEPKRAELPAGVTPPPLPKDARLPSTVTPGTPAVPGVTLPGQEAGGLPMLPTEAPAVSAPAPTISKPEPVKKAAVTEPGKAEGSGEPVKATVGYTAASNAGMLPPGSFADVSLLHGLDAATGTTAQANPMPVLLNVQNNATLPGSAKYALKSCFVLGSSFGDLSSERVYVQLTKLSCVDKNDRLILSADVQGYVVDSDGRLGLRGVVTDRQGSRLAKAMLAGFAQGLAGALKMSQGTVSTSPLGSIQSLTGGDALKSAGLQGAADANTQLAQFYLNEAKQMFPVLSVDAARTATIVFQQPVMLKWGTQDARYEQQVKPLGTK